MEPIIKNILQIKLVGKNRQMSVANNQTALLWQEFAPIMKAHLSVKQPDLFSMEVYDNVDYFKAFDPQKTFTKWAAIKESDLKEVPEGLEAISLNGLYACFTYKGRSSTAIPFYQYIYGQWLPQSDYVIDNRPHFALMGEQYKNDDPASEEEICIPIKQSKGQ
ncbi:MAG: GyrI-like domain-containing protein [Bacteroidota bacterium]